MGSQARNEGGAAHRKGRKETRRSSIDEREESRHVVYFLLALFTAAMDVCMPYAASLLQCSLSMNSTPSWLKIKTQRAAAREGDKNKPRGRIFIST